jgi:integrase
MASFTVCVRSIAKEYNTVYIRVIHKGYPEYIKTTLSATKKQLKGKNVKDNFILVQANAKIKEYIDKLNLIDYQNWDVKQVKQYLLQDNENISFTDYFNTYVVEMSKSGRDNPAKNYRTAYKNLQKFLGTETIYFKDLRVDVIKGWIKSLEHTARAKNLYPTLIRAVFESGLEKYNDYNEGILLIKNNPFRKDMIPQADLAEKRAINKRALRKIFRAESKEIRAQMAIDVSKLIFYLAGINTVDLYELEHSNFVKGKLVYNRHKTSSKRKDKAYFEIVVPNDIKPLFEKYKGEEKLFDFSERYSDFNSFNRNLNKGYKSLYKKLMINNVSSYTFRHSWATIAQNKCGASLEQVGFALNHSSAHKVTEGYVMKDFKQADELNKKVIDYLNKPIKRKVKRFRYK